MKTNAKKLLCISLAAAMAVPLAACSSEQAESAFDNPLPWHPTTGSYEKLDYSVAVYNTEKSEKESERVKIADGTLTFTLTENAEGEYTELKTDFTVKYDNNNLAGADAGLTDTITSTLLFQPNGLTAKTMTKTVTLADRKDQKNLSYTITADYFDTHKATLKYTNPESPVKTLNLSRNAARDNEIMFFAARAQDISKSSSTNFKMINIFDSFINGETAEYTMIVTGSSERKIDLGDWVKDFGIEAKTHEGSDEATYPVTCINTSIAINGEKSGPAYYVLYAKDSFKHGEAEHKKIPVKIDYSSYKGSNPYRHTEYKLTGCSFTKQA